MHEEYVEAVLAVAELIPESKVLSYGDIAALLDSGGPRQVGAVMSAHGNAVAWWRVIRASGAAPQGHERQALEHYLQESTALRGDTAAAPVPGKNPPWRVDMKSARWNPQEAEFELIDAVAGALHDASDPAPEASADSDLRMSVPRGELRL
ncbi:MGMT family protein [Arthrobacter sp. N199823]|uniref:MGMT family protein n=1 Tax=Arthrobacter sp. N199823 TaxID=2058895 RepID=UPI000CE37D5B|nr:MGMT family protein [Arthrobacter sp. N199823]